MNISFSYWKEIIEKFKSAGFYDFIKNKSYQSISKNCFGQLDFLADCFILEDELIEKIKILNERKTSIQFDLNHLQHYNTFNTLNEKKVSKKSIKSKNHNSIDELLNEISKPVFQSEINLDINCYLLMLEMINNKIAEILFTAIKSNEKTQVKEQSNSKITSIYSREQMGIFIALLQKQKIITDSNMKASSFLNLVTGYSKDTQRLCIPEKIEFLDYINDEIFDAIENDLSDMLDTLRIFNGKKKG